MGKEKRNKKGQFVKGHHHSREVKEKISKAGRGRKTSESTKHKLSIVGLEGCYLEAHHQELFSDILKKMASEL